jgi:hypothetical protein
MPSAPRLRVARVAPVLLLLLTFVLPGAGYGAAGPPSVGIYEMWEGSFTNVHPYQNPFNFDEIRLTATFRSPTHRQVVCTGFHDGNGSGGQTGTVWKVRFMGDEFGTWTYTTTWSDGTPGANGFFYVTSSNNLGLLRIDPQRPHQFRYQSGAPVFWNGETEWFFLSDSFTQQARLEAIDFLSQYSVNSLMMQLVNDYDFDVFPWLGTRFNMDQRRFNLARLHQWDEVIETLGERGITADLWFYADDSGSLLPPAYSFEEDLLFEYLIARFAAYSNVLWNLALEFQEYRNATWVTSRAQLVRDADPWDHILAVHEIPGTNYSFPGHPNLDRTSLQFWDSAATLNGKAIFHRTLTEQAGRPIPIVIDEFFIEGDAGGAGDLTRFRQCSWAIVLGGGYYRAASLGWWIGAPYYEQHHFEIAQHVADFMTTVPFWELEPANARTSNGYASLDAGAAILVYLPSGGSTTLSLTGFSGSLEVVWYNPRTGARIEGAPVGGGGPVGFTAPDTNDWVLYVYDPDEVPSADVAGGGGADQLSILRVPEPNPAGDRTRIRFVLGVDSRVELGLYGLSGAVVRRVLDGAQYPPGEHAVEVELKDLPTGLYWCRMRAGTEALSQKLLVFRRD